MAGRSRCIFVGNVPYDATEEQIRQILEEVGPVMNFRLVIDNATGKTKGYGFCEYKDEETAESAKRNLQGYELNGRQLRVDFADAEKTMTTLARFGPRPPGPFQGGLPHHMPPQGPPSMPPHMLPPQQMPPPMGGPPPMMGGPPMRPPHPGPPTGAPIRLNWNISVLDSAPGPPPGPYPPQQGGHVPGHYPSLPPDPYGPGPGGAPPHMAGGVPLTSQQQPGQAEHRAVRPRLQPQQPIGMPAAAAAASAVNGALEAGQSPSVKQTSGPPEKDQLTNQLAGMSKQQLFDMLAQMKSLIETNRDQARAILVANPQLAKGLFQAQVMLGMVKPTVLPPSKVSSNGLPDRKPAPHAQTVQSAVSKPTQSNTTSEPPTSGAPQPSAAAPTQQPAQALMDVDQQKALLDQVMRLTPEQVNALPPEQRAQVLQLQQALGRQ